MWGDGKQTRSFTFIDDCVEGILRITKSDFKEPLNLGSSEMVSGSLCRPVMRLDSPKQGLSRQESRHAMASWTFSPEGRLLVGNASAAMH